MNVRALLLTLTLALQACDWAAAERVARCNAGELGFCAGDAGSGDAGAPDAAALDAGEDAGRVVDPDAGSDAGTDAGIDDAGIDAGPSMTTVGLYPNDGGSWHVFNDGERGVVHVVGVDGGLVRETRLSGAVMQAYADSPRSNWLALLVDSGTVELVVVDAYDGGTFSTAVSGADILSVYVTPSTAPAVSLWSSRQGQYRQEILVPEAMTRGFMTMGPPQTSNCDIAFDDLEVLAPPADRVVIAYRAGVCVTSAGTPSEGVVAQSGGLQTITPAGIRASIAGHVSGTSQRVGRSGDGFNTASQTGNIISTVSYDWEPSLPGFLTTPCVPIEATQGTVMLGDVTEGLVTGSFAGQLSVGMDSELGTPRTAFLARVCNGVPWVSSLGPVVPGARVPVLVLGARVFISVQRPDGHVELLNREAATGN